MIWQLLKPSALPYSPFSFCTASLTSSLSNHCEAMNSARYTQGKEKKSRMNSSHSKILKINLEFAL